MFNPFWGDFCVWCKIGVQWHSFAWRNLVFRAPFFDEVIFSLGFHGGSNGTESACNSGDMGSISGLGRSPGEGNGYPFQYSWKVHGQGSLADYSPRGRKESDMTERLSTAQHRFISELSMLFLWSICLFLMPIPCCFDSNSFVIYWWPLNNRSLNYMSQLKHRCFSIDMNCSRMQSDPWLVDSKATELWMKRKADCKATCSFAIV